MPVHLSSTNEDSMACVALQLGLKLLLAVWVRNGPPASSLEAHEEASLLFYVREMRGEN